MGIKGNRNVGISLGITFALLCAMVGTGWACSAFQLKGTSALVGKSYDWSQSHGQIMSNARNLKKTSLLIPNIYPTESWTSKYGSLTFHQAGKEFPLGGMNEKGLVVEILWLATTEYPEADNRPALNELQWIQYQLDNFQSVGEVLKDLDKRRISAIFADVHYMVCDSTPECAVVEFLNKKEDPSSGTQIVANAITNNEYGESATYLKKFTGFGGTKAVPTSNSSLDRFARLAMQLDVPASTKAEDHAFDLLKSVETSGYSQWNIVYDTLGKKVSFRAPGGDVRSIDMSTFEFSCKKEKLGKWLDFHTVEKGDVSSSFAAFDAATNKKLVETGSAVMKGSVPDVFLKDVIKQISEYPNSLTCTE